MEAEVAAVFYVQEDVVPWQCADAVDVPHTCCISFPEDQPMPGSGSAPESSTLGTGIPSASDAHLGHAGCPVTSPSYEDLPYSHLSLSLGPWS